jgi:multidrug resistance efflux pump
MMDGSQVAGYARPADKIALPRSGRKRWSLKQLLIVALSLMLLAAAQRIPVKIDIDKGDPLLGRLRPGMSVEPTIDTRPANAASSSGRAS